MFNFPEVQKSEGFSYKNNFLKSVIFQVKYKRTALFSHKEYLDKKLKETFPVQKEITKNEIQLKIEKTPIVVSKSNTLEGYEYRSVDNKRVFSITADAMSLTIFGDGYSSFEKEFEVFKKAVTEICLFLKINSFIRLAVRKVNLLGLKKVDGSPVSVLPAVFKDQFLQSFSCMPDNNLIKNGLIKYDLADAQYTLKLSYGIPVENIPQDLKTIVIDIDIFKDKTEVCLGDLKLEMAKINAAVFDVFDYIICDNLKATLRGES
jgi:uncharacterized protein (TIGR04255 family)